MFKYIVILAVVSQVLAKPGMFGGMGGMAMNPWMSQWMAQGPGAAAPWAQWMPAAPAPAPAAPGASDTPIAPAAPALPNFAQGGMAIGAMNKQLGMAQAIIGSKVKAAEEEIKAQLDTLKSTATLVPADPCGAAAETAATDIENQLTTAFDACKMKDEMSQVRMQGLQFKQQMTAYKMAKKACKASLDPVTCMADATAATADAPTSTVGQTLVDINTKADDCIAENKENLLSQIDNALDELLVC